MEFQWNFKSLIHYVQSQLEIIAKYIKHEALGSAGRVYVAQFAKICAR